jgi:hypothetical protein
VFAGVAVVAGLLAPAAAAAQVQGLPVDPPAGIVPAVVTGSPVIGLPVVAPMPDPWPPLPATACPPALPCDPHAAPECPPDDPFHFLTRSGCAIDIFPRTLLWEPQLADLKQPRMAVYPNSLSNAYTRDNIDTQIGGILGLVRVKPATWETAVQVDFFAVVNSRFAEHDYFIASNYRFGFPVTFASGPWHAKVSYEHTSTHLGDEIMNMTGRQSFDYIKDELVVGLGRYWCDQRVRVYGQAAWAFFQYIPGDPSPFRFDIGAEWVRRRATGWTGQPFAATNLEFNGATDYNANFTLQLGWMWRDPTRRLAQVRVFGEYYTGRSPYGQFFQDREDWFGFGAALDY